MGNVMIFMAEAVSAPSGLWVTILNWIEGGVVNFGWTILLFTLLLKFALLPFDFLIKYSTKKSTLVQQKLAPQTARLQKKYANNQQEYQAQVNAMYKKEGYNMVGSCIIMLVNLVITMVVFFTMFASLREVSAYKTIQQYDTLQSTYQETMMHHLKTDITDYDFNAENFSLSEFLKDEANKTKYSKPIAKAKVATEKAVMEVWNNSKDNWLWIKNIWVADGAKSSMPTYTDLQSMAKNAKIGEYNDYVTAINQDTYAAISNMINSNETSWNGYYILAILAAATTFLSQWVAQLSTNLKKKELNKVAQNPQSNAGMMKFMKIFLPAMMVIFVISSSASFGIYVVTSSIAAILTSYITGLIVNLMTRKKEAEVTAYLEKENLKLIKKQNKKKGV